MFLNIFSNIRQFLPRRVRIMGHACLFCTLLFFGGYANAAKCLFISSYHVGYDWADGIETGVRNVLDGKCELRQVDMDTKRNKSEAYKVQKGLEVKQLIEQWRPDVVIAADDNATKYVVMPYFKDNDTPFVFCGINWTVEEYGYPYSNATGMIEVSPIRQMFQKLEQMLPGARAGFYIGADTLTEQKSYERFRRIAARNGIELINRLASTQAEWEKNYIDAQQGEFIVLGTKSGINDWDDVHADTVVAQHGSVLSLTTYEWMTRFAVFGMTKIAEEQGEWAAKTALQILDGTSPGDIQIIPNQKWDMIVNVDLADQHKLHLPEHILIKSKHVHVQ